MSPLGTTRTSRSSVNGDGADASPVTWRYCGRGGTGGWLENVVVTPAKARLAPRDDIAVLVPRNDL